MLDVREMRKKERIKQVPENERMAHPIFISSYQSQLYLKTKCFISWPTITCLCVG